MSLWESLLSALSAKLDGRTISYDVTLPTGYTKPREESSMEFKHFNTKDDPLIVGVADSTMSRTDDAREFAGVPFEITCGCRTPEHNAVLKGAVADSAHLAGPDGFCHALDLKCEDDHVLFCMLLGIIKAGFHRIGIYVTKCVDNPNRLIPRHLHIDDDPTKPPEVVWILMEQN